MMHQLLSARDGQYIGGITGRPAEKGNGHLSGDSSLSAAAMGTNDGAAEGSISRPDPSQSTSRGTTADLQVSSMFAESMKGSVRGLGFFEAQMQQQSFNCKRR